MNSVIAVMQVTVKSSASSGLARGSSRRHTARTAKTVSTSSAVGQMIATRRSAMTVSMNRSKNAVSAAIGRSTSRDQCMSAPSGGSMRWLTRSNQPCPFIQLRTCASRWKSSVSGIAPSLSSNGTFCQNQADWNSTVQSTILCQVASAARAAAGESAAGLRSCSHEVPPRRASRKMRERIFPSCRADSDLIFNFYFTGAA